MGSCHPLKVCFHATPCFATRGTPSPIQGIYAKAIILCQVQNDSKVLCKLHVGRVDHPGEVLTSARLCLSA